VRLSALPGFAQEEEYVAVNGYANVGPDPM